MQVRRLIWPVAVLAAVVAVAATVIVVYVVTFTVDRARYPITGIDVSHHQGAIDWHAVAADDVSFVYVKVSEGGDYRDPRYRQNLAGADAAGIPAGAYHYFTFCRSGADQAVNYLGAIAGETVACRRRWISSFAATATGGRRVRRWQLRSVPSSTPWKRASAPG